MTPDPPHAASRPLPDVDAAAVPLLTPPGIMLAEPPQAPPWLAFILTAATMVVTAAGSPIAGQPHPPSLAGTMQADVWTAWAAALAASLLLVPLWGCLTLLVDAATEWLLWLVSWPLWGAAGLLTLQFVATAVGAVGRFAAIGRRVVAAVVAAPAAAWPAGVAATVAMAGAPSHDGRDLFGGLSLLLLGASAWAVGRALAAAPSYAAWLAVVSACSGVGAAMAVAALVGVGAFALLHFTMRVVAAVGRARARRVAEYVPLAAAAAVAAVPSVDAFGVGDGMAAGAHTRRVSRQGRARPRW